MSCNRLSLLFILPSKIKYTKNGDTNLLKNITTFHTRFYNHHYHEYQKSG